MDRRHFLVGAGALAAGLQYGREMNAQVHGGVDGSCQVAAYYFGNYHVDAHNAGRMGPIGPNGIW